MTARPQQPPQHVRAGDRYATEVAVVFNGITDTSLMWVEVDAPRGLGWRYYRDDNGAFVTTPDDKDLAIEVVKGDFKIVWRNE